MLVQLHCQNPKDFKQTEMLMQGEINSRHEGKDFYNSIESKWKEFQAAGMIPDGWVPMVCNENYELFTRATQPA